ncbi:hypothetical protein ACQ4PT_001379 [Festuca glaucescens]
MACSFVARVSLFPALLLAQPAPLAISSRLRPGSARGYHRVLAAARPARRTLGSVRYGTGAAALRAQEAEVAVPPLVPVRVAYELQLAGHRYLDVRTDGEFGAGHPAGAVNISYMYSTGSGMSKNSHFVEQVSAIFGRDAEIIIVCPPPILNMLRVHSRDRHSRRVLCLEGERAAGQPMIAGGWLL